MSPGIAISEACELAVKGEGTCYALGSVLNHVMLHQTVIGEETMLQMQKAEIEPDYIIACMGGNSISQIHVPHDAREDLGEKRH